MAKIIDIKTNIVSIGTSDGTIEEVRADDLNFVPHIGDEVEIFKTETKTIVNKVEKNNDLSKGISINVNQAQNAAVTPVYMGGKVVNKVVYACLAIFLGCIGGHKFYAGKIGQGIMYLLFCWTTVPAIIGFIEGITAALKTADANGNIVV